ncbi:MAG: hypothetical protein MIK27_16720 [Sphingomonas sanguinis]|jgi:hypothetical protein|nr:hypothetical protein [Sphingomonas sanguinis]NNG48443.1 hypothetical protein [Sphingomonas sanguinis]
MLQDLRELHHSLRALMQEHRALCEAPSPDSRALGHIRWRLAHSSRQRMTFLHDVVFVTAERHADVPGAADMLSYKAALPAYRQRISTFLARWPMDAIIAEWGLYRAESARFRPDMHGMLQTEDLFLSRLESGLATSGRIEPLRPTIALQAR